MTPTSTEALRDLAGSSLVTARERTQLLTGCVGDADLTRQHSPLMSPLVWDLAHVANQEELWLLRAVGGREPMHPEIDPLYDAFEHPRAERPTLPLLPPAEARAYAHEVRGRVLDLLEAATFSGTRLLTGGFAFGMIAQHEQQHDETMLATHQLRTGAPVLSAPDPLSTQDAVAAARHGPTDPIIGDVSVTCFEAAEAALGRLAAPRHVMDAVSTFAERYVARYRCPADDRLDEARAAASA